MNKLVLGFCVFLITGLFADDESNIANLQQRNWANNEAGSVQECPAPKPCCKEKCCPCPKPPVCCECYVPNYYDLQCNTGLFFYGDFLYWYANEDNLSPCLTIQGNNTVISGTPNTNLSTNPIRGNHLKTKWDPGFRVGLGFDLSHDGWDIEANYTWYHNKKNQSFSVPAFGSTVFPFFPSNGQLALADSWVNHTVSSIFNPAATFLFNSVSSRWKLTFNQIDLELGRKFWLSRYMAMRAYAGVRGAWFTTRFNNLSTNTSTSTTFTNISFADQFKDRAWDVGLLVGIEPEWHFCRNFILFSNLDAALMWGKFRVKKTEDYSGVNSVGATTINYHNTYISSFFKMQAVLDLALGLRWEETWCYRIRTALDVGWEHHIWFDVNHRPKFNVFNGSLSSSNTNNSVGIYGYDELQGNIMMGGLVVRFRVDF